MFLRTIEDGVQPPVAGQTCARAFNHPADAGRNELAAPWKPPSASSRRTGTTPFVSCRFARETSIARGTPYLSTARWILTPRIFFPPSMPRSKQLGAERQDRLSMTTALGSGVSPQASA